MKLLSTSTFKLHEFYENDDMPPYAILSHRWEKEEVSYQDISNGFQPLGQKDQKLLDFCKQAALDGFDYCVSVFLLDFDGPDVIQLRITAVDSFSVDRYLLH